MDAEDYTHSNSCGVVLDNQLDATLGGFRFLCWHSLIEQAYDSAAKDNTSGSRVDVLNLDLLIWSARLPVMVGLGMERHMDFLTGKAIPNSFRRCR
jgi:hypothetical protein